MVDGKEKRVAIIGMSCRFAKAKDYREYWNLLKNGMNAITQVPKERWDIESYYSPDVNEPNKSNSQWLGIVDDYAFFDNMFFKITPEEAKNMDPQQRLLLEETWKCIEDSGYSLKEFQNKTTSVYVGALTHDFLEETIEYNQDVKAYNSLGTFSCMMSNRISYIFNFKGNSHTIEAACTSGLVGLHQAKVAILNGECDYAIVAGVNLCLNPWRQISYSKAHMLSDEGKCKTFAQDADGFVSGDGVAVVLLGDLEKAINDKANIYAVIKGTGVTHVGRTSSLTAPGVEGQRRAVELAFDDAKFRKDSVTYLESHGTGTLIGDTMEVEALRRAYSDGTSKLGFCRIGSEKTNIGHTEAASGIAALIKVILMMQHKMIVPSINCVEENPLIKFKNTPFKLADRYEKWEKSEGERYRAGINGFGFGGVNAHILIEEYSQENQISQMKFIDNMYSFLFSAKTRESLFKIIDIWKEYVESQEFEESSLEDVCKTLCSGRDNMRFRTGGIVSSKEELKEWLHIFSDKDICDVKEKSIMGLDINSIFVNNAITIFNKKDMNENINHMKQIISDSDVRYELENRMLSEKESDLILNIYISQRLFESLLYKNVCMQYVCGSGTLNVWNGLIASGMVSEEQIYKYLLKKSSLEDIDINLVKIPYYDLKMKRYFQPVVFTKDYFTILKKKLIETIDLMLEGNTIKEYYNDVLALYKYQRTFKKGFKEWEKICRCFGFELSELMNSIINNNNGNYSEITFFVICTMLIKNIFQEKYSLRDEYQLNDTALGEMTRLISYKILDKEDVIQFLLTNQITEKQLAEKANHNVSLEINIDEFTILREMGCQYFDGKQQFKDFIKKLSEDDNEDEYKHKHYSIPVVQSEEELLTYFCLNGCDILWDKVYPSGTFRKKALPGYIFNGKYYGLFHNKEIQGKKAVGGKNMRDVNHIDIIEESLQKYLTQLIEEIIHTEEGNLDVNASFVSELGLGSIEFIKLYEKLESVFGDISPAILYEYSTISMLKTYLLKYYSEKVTTMFNEEDSKEKNITEEAKSGRESEVLIFNKEKIGEKKDIEIAIVGLSGRYPKSKNTEELWKYLLAGENLITEVPKSRWDTEVFYTEDRNKRDKSYTKWGGYLEDYDKFDHYFFNIAPSQAKMMDPQQRVFLEVAHETIEDAGYTKENVGREVGVFVGATTNTYGLIAAQEAVKGNLQCVDNDFYDIANRVSYFMDWIGPSMTIDSACSSSLTAVHLAVNALKNGDCKAALVGSVSLTLHPNRIIQFCQKNMLLQGKDYYPFGNGSGGFVDSEGAGAILLKPYDEAVKNRDHIYAIIKGTAVNSGGRTSGYTVPNPKAQADLIEKAIEVAKVSPRTIQYVEAHGTGTKLGDPIEIQGLTEAYRKYTNDLQFCSIGSIKSNIGHTISVAGMAGLTKVLLQLKYKTIVKSIFGGVLNPMIKFEKTPFYVQEENREWNQLVLDGKKIPRRAAVSAFGAGGSNAHVILEESPETMADVKSAEQIVFLLSAKSQEILKEYAKKFIDFLEHWNKKEDFSLINAAYTLQTGRIVLKERMAFVTDNFEDLLKILKDFYDGKENQFVYLGGKVLDRELRNIFDDEEGKQYIDALIRSRKQEKLAKLWVSGIDINWEQLYENKNVHKMSLPTYPFERITCWIPVDEENKELNIRIEDDRLKSNYQQKYVPLPPIDISSIMYENEWLESPISKNSVINKLERTIIFSNKINSDFTKKIGQINSTNGIYDIKTVLNQYEYLKELCIDLEHIIVLVEPFDEDEIMLCEFTFKLTKFIVNSKKSIRVSIITNRNFYINLYDKVNPIGASLYGFFAVLEKEHMLNVHVYDIDEDCRVNSEKLLGLLTGTHTTNNEVLIGFRNQKCYTRHLKNIKIKGQNTTGFRENGTYLLIGGAGNLGSLFSVGLSKYYHANVILFGRRETDEKIAQLIAEIDNEGGKGFYIQGNVVDEKRLKEAIEIIEQRFGKIHGVMNLSMVLNHKIFDDLSWDEFRRALEPKINGSIVLSKVFRERKIDFMLSFSSIQSYSNNIEYSDYSAGSTYEDSYMFYMNSNNLMNCKIVNWGYWGETAENSSGCSKLMFSNQGQEELLIVEGIKVLEHLLTSENTQVVAFKGNNRYKKRVKVVENNSMTLNQIYLRLKELCEIQILFEFQKEGFFCQEGEIHSLDSVIQQLNITNKFERVTKVLLDTLEKAGYLKVFDSKIIVLEKVKEVMQIPNIDEYINVEKEKYLEIVPHLEESREVLKNMMKIMREEVKAVDCIFKDGSVDLIKDIYKNNQLAASYGKLVSDELEKYITKRLPTLTKGEKIKIVEVGAGVGGVSNYVFKMLEKYADKIEYVYTDVSKFFLIHARKCYKYSFLKFEVLNIEKELEAQGYKENSFDVLIASNVIHATEDINVTLDIVCRLLKHDSKIILNEMNDMFAFLCPLAIFLDGWWLFSDEHLRIKNSPLLSVEQWTRLFQQRNITDIKIKYNENVLKDVWNQNVISGILKKEVEKEINRSDCSTNDISIKEISDIVKQEVIKVLEVDEEHFDVDIPFAESGVDSILAKMIILNINNKLSVDMKITDLFVYSTVGSLSSYCYNNLMNKRCDTRAVQECNDGVEEDNMINQWLDRLAKGEVDVSDISTLMGE